MQITFKGKVRTVYNPDETEAWKYIQVPVFTSAHVDMNAARRHPRYGGLANSTLFPNALKRIRTDKFGKENGYPLALRLDRIPDGVTVDTSGFLAVVTFEV